VKFRPAERSGRRRAQRFRRTLVSLVAGGLACAGAALGPAPARADDPGDDARRDGVSGFLGPLPLQDVFLPMQMRPQLYPESAELLPRGGFAFVVRADWTNHFAADDTFLFDGESVTATAQLRFSPLDRLELGLDVPWTSRFDGTLDPFIEDVEDALDARVRERFEMPRFQSIAVVVRDDGSERLRMPDDHGLGDVSLRVKAALVREPELGFDAALVASLGIPTGRSTYGGAGWTPGIGLHLQKPFDTVNLFGGATLQHHTDAREQDFRLAPWRWMTYAGAEWRPFRSWLGLLAEYQVYGPLARTNDPLSDPAHYYAGGFRFYLPGGVHLDATVIENMGAIENDNSSDVTFQFVLGWRFLP